MILPGNNRLRRQENTCIGLHSCTRRKYKHRQTWDVTGSPGQHKPYSSRRCFASKCPRSSETMRMEVDLFCRCWREDVSHLLMIGNSTGCSLGVVLPPSQADVNIWNIWSTRKMVDIVRTMLRKLRKEIIPPAPTSPAPVAQQVCSDVGDVHHRRARLKSAGF